MEAHRGGEEADGAGGEGPVRGLHRLVDRDRGDLRRMPSSAPHDRNAYGSSSAHGRSDYASSSDLHAGVDGVADVPAQRVPDLRVPPQFSPRNHRPSPPYVRRIHGDNQHLYTVHWSGSAAGPPGGRTL
jgi:hypothetical protein